MKTAGNISCRLSLLGKSLEQRDRAERRSQVSHQLLGRLGPVRALRNTLEQRDRTERRSRVSRPLLDCLVLFEVLRNSLEQRDQAEKRSRVSHQLLGRPGLVRAL